MRYSAQIRAARALLGWSQDQLARRAKIGLATLRRMEQTEGIVKGNFSTVLKIQKALEQAGIHFIEDDPGEMGIVISTHLPPPVMIRMPRRRRVLWRGSISSS